MQLSARDGACIKNRLVNGKDAKQLHFGTTKMPWRALLPTLLNICWLTCLFSLSRSKNKLIGSTSPGGNPRTSTAADRNIARA
jgi:hypothetical protein